MDRTGKFHLTAGDASGAAMLFAWSSLLRPKIVVSWLVLWLIGTIGVSYLALDRFPLTPAEFLKPALWMLVPFVVVIAFVFIMTPINARRIFRQQRSLQVEVAFAWADNGFEVDSEYGSFLMPWSHFLRWTENDTCFVLFESDRLYRMIPKRVLNPEQIGTLRSQLARIGN